MLKTKLICLHGSPGIPEEFELLAKNLQNDFDVIPVIRKSYPDRDKFSHFPKIDKTPTIILGHSWGAWEAISKISEIDTQYISGMILVSPLIITEKFSDIIKRNLLNFPIIGDWLLEKKRDKAIDTFITHVMHPENSTKYPENLKKALFDPEVIRTSMNERCVQLREIEFASSVIKQKRIPIGLIWGDKDYLLDRILMKGKISDYLPIEKSEIISGAGHAIHITNTEKLANFIRSFKLHIESDEVKSKNIGYIPGTDIYNNVYNFLQNNIKTIPDNKVLQWLNTSKLQEWFKDQTKPLNHDSIDMKTLYGLSEKLSVGFKNLGIEFNDMVILFLPMSVAMYASMFALVKIGAVPVFLDSWARRNELSNAAAKLNPKAIITFEQVFLLLNDDSEIQKIPVKICYGPTDKIYSAKLEELFNSEGSVSIEPVNGRHTALITFTTGSSGKPKGANRTHRFLAAQRYALQAILPYKDGDVDLPCFPIFSLNNAAAGINSVIPSVDLGARKETDSIIIYNQLVSTNATNATLSPAILRNLSQFCISKNLSLPNINRIVTGGAPVSIDDLNAIKKVVPNAEIFVLYGSTEVEPIAKISFTDMLKYQGKEIDPEIVSQGVNVGNFTIGIRARFIKTTKDPIIINEEKDWNNYLVPNGQPGEIIVTGEHVCNYYYKDEEATKRAKIFDAHDTIWHRTGDVGYLDCNNNVWLVGRIHNAIRRANNYLFPVQAEIVLKKLSFVQYAAFIGIPDAALNEKAVCAIVPKESSPSENNMREEINRIMKKNNLIVDGVVFVKDIPLDSRHQSKVDYNLLRQNILEILK